MANQRGIRRSAVQRLRDLFPRASAWDEAQDVQAGAQRVDIVVRFQIGGDTKTFAIAVASQGQPRQVREVVSRLEVVRRAMPEAYPVAVADYVSPQSAALLRGAGMGYLDLSGNCHLSFDNVLIDREGRPNLRPSTRPLKSLFAPRATRVARVLLVDPQHAWRLEELAKAADVSLGHSHNVIKRLEELSWVERGEDQRMRLVRPGELLDAWVEEYSYRRNEVASFISPERVTRRLAGELVRVAEAEGRRVAFTMHAGAALVAPQTRMPVLHCYVDGPVEPVARALGLQPAEGEGHVHLLLPYDAGVFYAPFVKGGLPVVCLPQLYADLYHYERRGRAQASHLRHEAMGY
jgi:hypothetical protein